MSALGVKRTQTHMRADRNTHTTSTYIHTLINTLEGKVINACAKKIKWQKSNFSQFLKLNESTTFSYNSLL